MPEVLKTPGVYIVEKDAFGSSVVQVPTAIPAFIGYTEKAAVNGQSFAMRPMRIASLPAYELLFGRGPVPSFDLVQVDAAAARGSSKVSEATGEKGAAPATTEVPAADYSYADLSYALVRDVRTEYLLYNSLKLFFDNGGGDCFVVSVGLYGEDVNDTQPFLDGLAALTAEDLPTMVLVPDALLLEEDGYYAVANQVLAHCGKMQSRIGLFDIFRAEPSANPNPPDYVKGFRENIGLSSLSYGAAYYPWLMTNVVQSTHLGYQNLTPASFGTIFTSPNERTLIANIQAANYRLNPPADGAANPFVDTADPAVRPLLDYDEDDDRARTEGRNKLREAIEHWDSTLKETNNHYKLAIKNIKDKLNLLPATPAIAGLFARVDATKGVWKAPANESLNSVIAPSLKITSDQQEELNVDMLAGKSINVIRSFPGRGAAIVWGARTLMGNSKDWRYINIRRLFLLIEQSVKNAAFAVVFEPNVSLTWVTVKGMLDNFLTGLWKQGALAGASPEEAFTVSVGLGSTMTADDILEGIMRISVKAAPSRPAEFIVITFEQQMQKS